MISGKLRQIIVTNNWCVNIRNLTRRREKKMLKRDK